MTFPFVDLPGPWGTGTPPQNVNAVDMQNRVTNPLNLLAEAFRAAPQGIVAVAFGPSAQTDYSATPAVAAATTTAVVAGRNYEITVNLIGTQVSATGTPTVHVLAAGAEVARVLSGSSTVASTVLGGGLPIYYTPASSGNVTFQVTAQSSAGAFRLAASVCTIALKDLGT